MEVEFRGWPYRRHKDDDLEAGKSGNGGGFIDITDDEGGSFSPFDITTTKNAPIERLERSRQAALVLNAFRRFRYTLDLKKEEEKKEIIRKSRTHTQVFRAANLFKEVAEKAPVTQAYPGGPTGGYGVTLEELFAMSKEHDLPALQHMGGVTWVAEKLKSNLEKGISGNDKDILQCKDVFGANAYPWKKGRSFWQLLREACQDLTLIILMVAAVASLSLVIKSEIAAKLMMSFHTWKSGPCVLPICNPCAGGGSNGGGSNGGGGNGGGASGGRGNGGGASGGGGNGGGASGGGRNGGGGNGRGGNGGGGNGSGGRDWFQVLSQVLSNLLALLNLLVAIAALNNHSTLAILSIDNAIAVSLVTLLTILIMLTFYIFRAF